MKKFFLLFVFLLANLNFLYAEKSDEWRSKKLYEDAVSDMRKGLYLTAYDKLSEAYWLDPFNEAALNEMDKMTKKFKKNLAKWGYYDFMQKAYAEGFLYYTRGEYKKAMYEWGKILTLKENTEVRGYYDFVKDELKKGLKQGEIKYGGKAKKERIEKEKKKKKKPKKRKKAKPKLRPSPPKPVSKSKKVKVKIDKAKAEAFYNEGLKEYSQGYLKLAIASWKKVLKYNPNHSRAKRALKRAQTMLEKK
ncbi:MAG: hypothetical protein J7L54_05820 [Elusimicrobia bacterium]|nr:hypothetical protein [Elusimicrobiota bacterium]